MLHDSTGRPIGVTYANSLDLFIHLLRDHKIYFTIAEYHLPRHEAYALWLTTHLDAHHEVKAFSERNSV